MFASAAVAALAATAAIAGVASAETTLPIPPIKVLVHGNTGRGDFFVSPFGDATTYANGAEIVDPSGNVVWFHQVTPPEEIADFRVQTYEGQQVLTFWQGIGAGGHASGRTTSTTTTTNRSPRSKPATASSPTSTSSSSRLRATR